MMPSNRCFFFVARPLPVHVAELHFVVAAAEQHDLLCLLRQLLPRRLRIELVMLGHRRDQREVIRVLAIPTLDRAAGERQVRIGDHAQGIEEVLETDAITSGTRTGRTVERKHLGFERGHAVAALGAGLPRGKQHFVLGPQRLLRVVRRESRRAARQFECGLERFGQTLRGVAANAQSVHHRLDGVFLLGVELRQRVELVYTAIDARAHESLAPQLLEHLGVLTLAIDDDGREQQNGEAVRKLDDLVHHLAHGLCRKIDAVIRTARDARTREQQA
jgi:hypothetical protein